MKEDANDYRPITLAPGLSKILEKVTSYWQISFLDKIVLDMNCSQQ
jgi:hypothetical protein